MRLPSILALALPCALACGASPTVGGTGRPPPRKVEPEENAVTIRNNCPEPVTIHLGPTEPGPSDELIELSGSGIEQRKLGKRARLWLRYREEWSRRRSAGADGDGWVLEIVGSCDGVSSRPGPL